MFGWRRQTWQPLEATDGEDARLFVPAVVDTPLPALVGRSRESKQARRSGGISRIIELEIDGVMVWVGRGAEAKTVAAVIRALKAGA